MQNEYNNFNNYDSFEATPIIVSTNSDSAIYHQFHFKKINTYWLIVLQLTIVIAFYFSLFIPFQETSDSKQYNFIVLAYIIIWLFIAVIYWILNYYHKKERSRGYLKLFRQTQMISLVPLIIWAVGIALIALLFVFVPVGTTSNLLNLRAINFLQIFIGIEDLIIVLFNAYYIYIIYSHNKAKLQPDAAESLNLTTTQSQDKVIEQQAEQIRYLQEARKKLGKIIVDLNHRIERVSSEDSDSYGNQSYLLTQKDDEIRALTEKCKRLEFEATQFSRDGDLFKDKSMQLQKSIEENRLLHDQLNTVNQELIKLQLIFEMEKNTVIELQNKYDDLCLEYEKITGKKMIDQTIYDHFLIFCFYEMEEKWDYFERRFNVEKQQRKEYSSVVGDYEGDIEAIEEPVEYEVHLIHFTEIEQKNRKNKPNLIRVRLNMLSPLLSGLVTDEEKRTFQEIEKKLEEELTNLRISFVKVGIEIGSCLYTIDFYASNFTEHEFEYQLEDLQTYYREQEGKEYNFQLYTTKDAKWDHYCNYLLPSKYEVRWMNDRNIVKNLIHQNDMLNVPRFITHRLTFNSDIDRSKFISLAEEIGFEVVEKKEIKQSFIVDIKREDEALFRSLHFVVLDLMVTAEKLGGTYDLWQCEPVTEIPHHPLKDQLYA